MQGGRPNVTPDTTTSQLSDDLENMIAHNYSVEQVRAVLKSGGMDDKKVNEHTDQYTDKYNAIKKSVKKFLHRIEKTYGELEIPKLISKGIKHAHKIGLSDKQRELFLKFVKEGDHFNTFMAEKKPTSMARFLGHDKSMTPTVNIEPVEHSKLNELSMLHDASKHIHNDVKHSLTMYVDCAYQAVSGTYDKKTHNVNVAIHPIIAALFLPKIKYIEDRMLVTNIARVVLSRSAAYLKNGNHFNAGTTLHEITCDFDLANDIAYDPNAGEYFMDSSPLDNLIKRYRAQVELYQSVLNLRQGRYFGKGYTTNDDGISGFLRIINTYEWTFFDSPDLYHVQDEGTILRKLLAIFSCRPTFLQLSTLGTSIYASTLQPLSKTTFINVPIINLRLPSNIMSGNTGANQTIPLTSAMRQTDVFIEHRTPVPKHKEVVYSNKIAFFYANRRSPTINVGPQYNNPIVLKFMNSPYPFSFSSTNVNNTPVDSPTTIPINNKMFMLRSVVAVGIPKPAQSNISSFSNCSALIRFNTQVSTFRTTVQPQAPNSTYYYNPYECDNQWVDPATNIIQTVDPIYEIDDVPPVPNPTNILGADNIKRYYGTIYVYTEV